MKIWADRTAFRILAGKLLMREAWEIDEFMDGQAAGPGASLASARRNCKKGWKILSIYVAD
jgi:hypothetical protein